MKYGDMLSKMANSDYKMAYDVVRTAIARCPQVTVMMNDEMIRKTGISNEMEVGGYPVVRCDGKSELAVAAIGKSGKKIMLVFDRSCGAFRCAVGDSFTPEGAKLFRVKPDDIPDFLYKATMA